MNYGCYNNIMNWYIKNNSSINRKKKYKNRLKLRKVISKGEERLI